MQNINLELLKKQKQILVELANEPNRFSQEEIDALDGIIHLLDSIQDENEFEIEYSVSYHIASQISYQGKSGHNNEYYKFHVKRHWIELIFDDEEGEVEFEYNKETGEFVNRILSIQLCSDEEANIINFIKTKLWK